MEIRDIGTTCFGVFSEKSFGNLNRLNILCAKIKGVTVLTDGSILYYTDVGTIDASFLHDSREAAIDHCQEILRQHITDIIMGNDPTVVCAVEDALASAYVDITAVVSHDVMLKTLMRMDKAVRCINDEENGIFEDWIALHVPDGYDSDELKDLTEGDLTRCYLDACEFFARRISKLIVDGDYDQRGFCLEFYNPKSSKKED